MALQLSQCILLCLWSRSFYYLFPSVQLSPLLRHVSHRGSTMAWPLHHLWGTSSADSPNAILTAMLQVEHLQPLPLLPQRNYRTLERFSIGGPGSTCTRIWICDSRLRMDSVSPNCSWVFALEPPPVSKWLSCPRNIHTRIRPQIWRILRWRNRRLHDWFTSSSWELGFVGTEQVFLQVLTASRLRGSRRRDLRCLGSWHAEMYTSLDSCSSKLTSWRW